MSDNMQERRTKAIHDAHAVLGSPTHYRDTHITGAISKDRRGLAGALGGDQPDTVLKNSGYPAALIEVAEWITYGRDDDD